MIARAKLVTTTELTGTTNICITTCAYGRRRNERPYTHNDVVPRNKTSYIYRFQINRPTNETSCWSDRGITQKSVAAATQSVEIERRRDDDNTKKRNI